MFSSVIPAKTGMTSGSVLRVSMGRSRYLDASPVKAGTLHQLAQRSRPSWPGEDPATQPRSVLAEHFPGSPVFARG